MKLEVGMYVRTDRGKIGKLHKELKDYYELEYPRNVCDLVYKNRIIKSSFNIIDLIEVGDYVNGYYVEDILKTFINVATGSNYFQSPTIYEQDIKSIVTKEEFEQISYKVGE